jgi:hypothetical protein
VLGLKGLGAVDTTATGVPAAGTCNEAINVASPGTRSGSGKASFSMLPL